MCVELMSLEVHLGVKDDKFLFQTFLVRAHEMIFAEMLLKRAVVDVILLLAAAISSIA